MHKMLLPAAFIQQLHRHVRNKIQQLTPTRKLMNMATAFLMLSTGLVPLVNGATPGSELALFYYDGLCPDGFGTLRFQNLTDAVVAPRIAADPSLAPALMRLAFHDCFGGCDASVLLNSTAGNVAEKDAPINLSLRGFEVIDAVKTALELVCPGVFSCADIVQEVALAAQRYVVQPGPKSQWPLSYGRRDGRVSLATTAIQNLPLPEMNYTQLVANFAAQGLNKFDLVALSGAHTFGTSHCNGFTERLYNFYGNGTGTDPALDPDYAASLKAQCPPGSPNNVVKMDVTSPDTFDNNYYSNLHAGKALLASDDAIKSAPVFVLANSHSNLIFIVNFALSFTKMTEIQVTLFPNGEIRSNCALRN